MQAHTWSTPGDLPPLGRAVRSPLQQRLSRAPRRAARAVLALARRRRADRAAAEGRLRAICDAMACGVLVRDERGGVVYANVAARSMLGMDLSGLDRGEAAARLRLVRPDGTELPRDELPSQVALRTGAAVRGSTIGVDLPSGGRRWFRVDAVPIAGPGERREAVVSLVDVTELRRAEAAAQQLAVERAARAEAEAAQARMRSLVEGLPQTFVAFDPQWRFIYVNRHAEEELGRSREALLGRTLWEVVPEIVGTRFEAELRRAATERVAVGFEAYYHPARTWYEVHARPCEHALVVHARNITARKRAEAQRQTALARERKARAAAQAAERQYREAAERLERLLDSTSDAIVLTDLEGRTLAWNRGAEAMFGWRREEVLGRILPTVPPELLEESRRRRERILANGASAFTFETERLTSDGRRIPVLTTVSPVRDERGEVVSLLGIHKDLTVHRQLAEQERRLALLEERERLARDLHDSALQTLYGVALRLAASERALADAREQARPILRQAAGEIEHAIRAIRGCILGLRPERGSLAAELAALADGARRACSAHLELELDPRAEAHLEAEARLQLGCIAREALSNATRHAGACAIALRLRLEGDRLVLRIEDDGRGFDPATAARGGGQGLRNMAKRARALGGRLRVASQPGSGTEVRVEVPLAVGPGRIGIQGAS